MQRALCVAILLLTPVSAQVSFSDGELRALEAADECAGDARDCALNALQVHATARREELYNTPGEISPVRKDDVVGLPLAELGTSELKELQALVSDEISSRGDLGADSTESTDGDDIDEEERGDGEKVEQPCKPPESAEETPEAATTAGFTTTAATTTPVPVITMVDQIPMECLTRSYTGADHGNELCFCQLVGNAGCKKTDCSCPQGCTGVAWEHNHSVSFKNKARAHGWPSTVILTSPRGYFSTISDLKAQDLCTIPIINNLLVDSFRTYQAHVHSGSVWQCFHGSKVASVKYLHLQTFTSHGSFHGMPTRNTWTADCVKMYQEKDSVNLAKKIAEMIH